LTTSGFVTRGVQFGGAAAADGQFANKRAEIYWNACEWIKDGGLLPPIPEMVSGLSSMTYGYDNKGRVLVEEKRQIKARLGRSPDLEDALCCTFAYPVAPKAQALRGFGIPPSLAGLVSDSLHVRGTDYDPYDRFAQEQKREGH
jgi:hypothetical protein